jgi:TusA-related sulfurtransferase
MTIQQQFKLHGIPDPFTLLKISQAFREISRGESLEFIDTGDHIHEELFKVLPEKDYEITLQEKLIDPAGYRIVLRKIVTESADLDNNFDGCQCR